MKLKNILFYVIPLLLVCLFSVCFYIFISGGGTIWGRLIFRYKTNHYLHIKYPDLQFNIESISSDFKSPNYYHSEIKPSDDTVNFYVNESDNGETDDYPYKHWENEVSDECNKILKGFQINGHCKSLIWLDKEELNFKRPFPKYKGVKEKILNSDGYANINIKFDSNYNPTKDFKKLLEIHDSIKSKKIVFSYQYEYNNFEFSFEKNDTIKTEDDFNKHGHEIKY